MSTKRKKMEELEFDPTQSVNEHGGVVIGRLSGPCADFISSTRNDRRYSEELWERVFNDPIIKEYFEAGGIFGELGHPADREETDMEKIALCLPKPPQKRNDGKLWATFDILDTPNGRILKTLCQYGYKMGISSRGSGDLFTDYDGKEAVDPTTYQLTAFDAVLLPAVKEARLDFTESMNPRISLKKALTESYSKSTEEEKKIMLETLGNLNLSDDIGVPVLIELSNDSSDVPVDFSRVEDSSEDTPDLGEDMGIANLLHDLIIDENEAIQGYNSAIATISEYSNYSDIVNILSDIANEEQTHMGQLEKALEVVSPNAINIMNGALEASKQMSGNIYESKQQINGIVSESSDINPEDDLAVDNNEAIVEELQKALKRNKELEDDISKLQEKLSVYYVKETSLKENLNHAKSSITKLASKSKSLEAVNAKSAKLSEKLEDTRKELAESKSRSESLRKRLSEEVTTSKNLYKDINALSDKISEYEADNSKLQESVETLKKDLSQKKTEYGKKLTEASKLVSIYKESADKCISKYIELQATRIGVSADDIKRKLNENYSFDNIDRVCENLQEYNLSMSKLPFGVPLNEGFKVKTSPSKNEYIKPASIYSDEVDDSLLRLAGIK